MKVNKRALLVEGIIIYEIILNYIVYPISIWEESTPPIVKIIGNTLLYGMLLTFIAVVIGVGSCLGIYYLFKWINEDQGAIK